MTRRPWMRTGEAPANGDGQATVADAPNESLSRRLAGDLYRIAQV